MEGKLKILFNEDVKLDAELIWRELENSKIVFKKLLVDNKKDFIEGLKSFNPDLIISDYSLPQFDGMKALILRNELTPLTPFILVTGSNNETVAVECMKAGADDYILKDNLSRLGHSVINAINKTKVLRDRNNAMEALKQSELRFKQISENSGEWIWEIDKNGLYKYSSSIVKDLLGFEPEEIVNKKYFYDLFTPETRDQLKLAALEAFSRKENFSSFINANLHKDGSVVILSTSGLPLVDDTGNLTGYRGVDTNITAQKHAEDAIIHERRMLRTMIDNLPDLIYIKDIKGRKLIANIADVRNIGFNSEEEVIGKTDIELFPGEIGKRGHIDDIEVINSGKAIFGREEDFVDAGGQKRWIMTTKVPLKDKNGTITGLVGIGHDITNRRNAEEELHQSYVFNESLLKTIPFGMDIVDERGQSCFKARILRNSLVKMQLEKNVGLCTVMIKSNAMIVL